MGDLEYFNGVLFPSGELECCLLVEHRGDLDLRDDLYALGDVECLGESVENALVFELHLGLLLKLSRSGETDLDDDRCLLGNGKSLSLEYEVTLGL